jgi:hypothetical protein
VKDFVKDFLLFRRMLSPIIIPLVFWVVLVLLVMGGIQELCIPEHRWKGLQVLIIGPLLIRLFCEFLLVFFRIDQLLRDIKLKLD